NKINRHAMLSFARRKTVYSRIIRLDPTESMRTASTSICGSFAQAFHTSTSVILVVKPVMPQPIQSVPVMKVTKIRGGGAATAKGQANLCGINYVVGVYRREER